MKLNNIFILICAVLALSACRNDEVPGKGKEARLSVKVKVKAPNGTKADDPHELPGEANINTLTVFVFAEDGTKTGSKFEQSNTEYEHEISGIEAESGASKVVVVANAPSSFAATIQQYSQLESALTQLADQEQTNLVMSSQVVSQTLSAGDNAVGGTLLLTRVPARLQVAGIYVDFKGKEKLAGRHVWIHSIKFDNVRSQSHYFSVADWGVVEEKANNYVETSLHSPDDMFVTDGIRPEYTDFLYRRYVMENAGMHNTEEIENPTRVVIRATLIGTADYKAETKTFYGIINQNGVHVTGMHDEHKYVYRNYVYNITLTFGPNSFTGIDQNEPEEPEEPEEPDDYTSLGVQVSVVEWGDVENPWEV